MNYRNISLEIKQLQDRLKLWKELREDAKNLTGNDGTKWREYVKAEINRMKKDLIEALQYQQVM